MEPLSLYQERANSKKEEEEKKEKWKCVLALRGRSLKEQLIFNHSATLLLTSDTLSSSGQFVIQFNVFHLYLLCSCIVIAGQVG